MTAPPVAARRRPVRAAGALALILTLVAALLGMLPGLRATPAGAAPAKSLSVVIDEMTPMVLEPKGTLTLKGQVVNNTGRALPRVDLTMKMRGQPLFRSEIAAQDANPLAVQPVGARGSTARVLDLAPGASAPWSMSVSASNIGLLVPNSSGVYALAVEASSAGQPMGTARTFLPWFSGKGIPKPLQVATVWPLIDRPRADGTTLGDELQTPVFRDDELAASFAPGGRLAELVAIGGTMNVSWMIDPDLLEAAKAMGSGYRVAPPGSVDDGGQAANPSRSGKGSKAKSSDPAQEGKKTPNELADTLPGTGGPAADAWLTGLKAAVAAPGTEVSALPYADTDVAAVAHALNGSSSTDLRPELTAALERARTGAAGLLGRPVRGDVAWPAQGAVDQEVLDLVQGMGARTVLASGESLPPSQNTRTTYTPSAKAALGGGTTALVTDPGLDQALTLDANRPGGRVEVTQRLLAELLTITLEAPQIQRTLVLTPPRTMDASLARILQNVSKASAGWTKPVTLDVAAKAPAAGTADRTLREYPKEARGTEPSRSHLRQARALSDREHTFASLLSRPERVTGPFDPAVLRLLSTQWRGKGDQAEGYRLGVTRSLRELEGLVRVLRRTGITLSGDSGTIPITVVNDLQQPVTLTVEVTSKQPNRLKVAEARTITVSDSHVSVHKFAAESAANGKVMLEVRMFTPDGRQFGTTETFFVNTTTIDGLTLWLIGAIALLLAIFSVRALVLRRRGAAASGNDGEDGAGGDGTGPEGADGTAAPEGDGTRDDPDDDWGDWGPWSTGGRNGPGGPGDQDDDGDPGGHGGHGGYGGGSGGGPGAGPAGPSQNPSQSPAHSPVHSPLRPDGGAYADPWHTGAPPAGAPPTGTAPAGPPPPGTPPVRHAGPFPGADQAGSSGGWSTYRPSHPRGGGNRPPEAVNRGGHTPPGSTTDRPE